MRQWLWVVVKEAERVEKKIFFKKIIKSGMHVYKTNGLTKTREKKNSLIYNLTKILWRSMIILRVIILTSISALNLKPLSEQIILQALASHFIISLWPNL